MTRDEVKQLVAMMAATWTRPPVLAETVQAYCFALADLDHAAAKAAVLHLMQTARFFPTIAEIRDAAVRSRVSLPSPEAAWGIVHRAISKHGSYRLPIFDCEEIDGAVADIGWKAICLSENIASERARFIDAFKSRAAKRIQLEATGKYKATPKAIPEWAGEHDRPIGDNRALVETGYPTATLEPRALRSGEPVQQLEPERKSFAQLAGGRLSFHIPGEGDAA
jgi:hypothetical protein